MSEKSEVNTCNCLQKENCPVDNKCLLNDVVYNAKVTSSEGVEQYVGITADPFKVRLNNHKHSFKSLVPKIQKSTTLSTYIWKLKKKDIPYKIDWKILGQRSSYKPGGRKCSLCLAEVETIFNNTHMATLNARSELFNSCRHRARFKLQRVKSPS